jgi:hypothetical protein
MLDAMSFFAFANIHLVDKQSDDESTDQQWRHNTDKKRGGPFAGNFYFDRFLFEQRFGLCFVQMRRDFEFGDFLTRLFCAFDRVNPSVRRRGNFCGYH